MMSASLNLCDVNVSIGAVQYRTFRDRDWQSIFQGAHKERESYKSKNGGEVHLGKESQGRSSDSREARNP